MTTRRTFLGLVAALAVSMGASAQAENKALTLQLGWLPNAGSAGEIAALQNGYFADAGLDVEILPGGPGANTIQTLMGGSADVVIAFAPQIMNAVNKDLPLASFGAAFQKAPLTFFSLGEKNITSVADWKGKRIGAHQSALPQIQVLLDNVGLTLDDITHVQAGVPGLMQDQVDVVGAWPTNVAQIAPILENGGGHNKQAIWDNGLQFQSNYYVAKKDALSSDPDTFAAFLTAVDKGWAWVADNQAETVEMLVAFAPALQAEKETPSLAMIVEDYIYTEETATEGFGNVSAARWQDTLDRYSKLGNISAALTAADVHNGSILDAVERTKRD